MRHNSRTGDRTLRRLPWQSGLLAAALAITTGAQAQVAFTEDFTGGVSTAGFTVVQNDGTCSWSIGNPNNRIITGAGFDADFAIFDSDFCGSSAGAADASLVSPAFDASSGNLLLTFDQQYRTCCGSTADVDVWDGSVWTNVYSLNTVSTGYPNPAVSESINITAAAGGSATAQVRFRYTGDWDYWWALDNISVEAVACLYPSDLAITGITVDGAMISWTDNGSAAYEWAITTGPVPDGTNEVVTGDGSDLNVTGLSSGTPYTAYVRSDCGGDLSPWSTGVSFTTGISNDDCDGAIALTVNPDDGCASTTAGTVAGATASGVASTCFGTADDDVWFSFVATAETQVISLLNVTGSTTDMYMALYEGSCGNLTLVPNSCTDPNTMNIGGLTIGNTYYLQVYTYTSTPGQTSAFDVCVGLPPLPPANDECAGAIEVPVNDNYDCEQTVAGTVAGATNSNITTTCGGTADDDVWFTFTATSDMHRIILTNTGGSTSDMYMAVWEGACGDLTLVPGSCSDPETLNISGLTPGNTYYLQVYTWTSTAGQTSTFDVCIGTAPTTADDYCNTLDFAIDVEPICNVTFAGINNDSPSEVNGSPALEDFTDLPAASVAAGQTYPISVTGNTNGPYTTYVTAFFDWDQNNIFETAVEIGSITNEVCSTVITADVVVPANAVPGTTRMRVVKNYFISPTDPCATYNFGQGEDYNVDVTSDVVEYCDSLTYEFDVEPICNVTFAGIDNTSSSEINGSPELEDFTTTPPAMVIQGQTYPISITGATGGNWIDYITAFFDWDQDGTFETVEELGFIENDDCTVPLTANITVPMDAMVGNTRMRLVKNYDESPLEPCATYGYGQGEDYTVTVDLFIGISSDAASGMSLMPNPAHDRIALVSPNGSATQAKVYDMVGHLVMNTGNVDAINIANLAPGSYILIAQDAAGTDLAHLRFVKQ